MKCGTRLASRTELLQLFSNLHENARHIVEEITLLTTRVNGATPVAAAADPTE